MCTAVLKNRNPGHFLGRLLMQDNNNPVLYRKIWDEWLAWAADPPGIRRCQLLWPGISKVVDLSEELLRLGRGVLPCGEYMYTLIETTVLETILSYNDKIGDQWSIYLTNAIAEKSCYSCISLYGVSMWTARAT